MFNEHPVPAKVVEFHLGRKILTNHFLQLKTKMCSSIQIRHLRG